MLAGTHHAAAVAVDRYANLPGVDHVESVADLALADDRRSFRHLHALHALREAVERDRRQRREERLRAQDVELVLGHLGTAVDVVEPNEQKDDRCRQRAHRSKGQGNVTIDTNGDLQQRIAELEQRNAELEHLIDRYINTRRGTTQPWKKTLRRCYPLQ